MLRSFIAVFEDYNAKEDCKMARIEGLRIKNFKVLKDVTLGPLNQGDSQPLTHITAVIGKNGVGKSALFDAFGFLANALKFGVEEACDARGRGGFEKLRTQGQTGPIEFEVFYSEPENTRIIGYSIAIETDEVGRPYVLDETMVEDNKFQTGNSYKYPIAKRLMAKYSL